MNWSVLAGPLVAVERLWGEKTNVKLEIRVASIPFFVRGVSLGGLIQIRPDHARRELVFERLRAESGPGGPTRFTGKHFTAGK